MTAVYGRVLFDGMGDELEPSDILDIQKGSATTPLSLDHGCNSGKMCSHRAVVLRASRIHNKQLHLNVQKGTGTVQCVGQFCQSFVEHPNVTLSHRPYPLFH